MPLLPLRRGIPCLTDCCDKVLLELVDELRREPLEVVALGLLVVAAAAFWRSKKRLCAVAILGAVATLLSFSSDARRPLLRFAGARAWRCPSAPYGGPVARVDDPVC